MRTEGHGQFRCSGALARSLLVHPPRRFIPLVVTLRFCLVWLCRCSSSRVLQFGFSPSGATELFQPCCLQSYLLSSQELHNLCHCASCYAAHSISGLDGLLSRFSLSTEGQYTCSLGFIAQPLYMQQAATPAPLLPELHYMHACQHSTTLFTPQVGQRTLPQQATDSNKCCCWSA